MARVLVPTLNAKVNPNPRGSATAHVTMAEANPFKRNTTAVREANQPVLHQMMPGMGSLGKEEEEAVPWYQKIGQSLIDNVGIPLLKQEVLDQPTQQLPSQGVINVPTTGQRQLPYTPPQQLPHGYPPQPPQQQGNGMANMMPWVIGGVGVLVVGGILFAKMGKKGGGRRRR